MEALIFQHFEGVTHRDYWKLQGGPTPALNDVCTGEGSRCHKPFESTPGSNHN